MTCDLSNDALEHLVNTYLDQFPPIVAVDRVHLIKLVKEFYASKGTENSYSFFFRAAYNATAKIINSSDNVIRVSAGEWKRFTYSTIIVDLDDIQSALGNVITGIDSGSSAVIESIRKIGKVPFSVPHYYSEDPQTVFYDGSTKYNGIFEEDQINSGLNFFYDGSEDFDGDETFDGYLDDGGSNTNVYQDPFGTAYEITISNFVGLFIPGEAFRIDIQDTDKVISGVFSPIFNGIRLVNNNQFFEVDQIIRIPNPAINCADAYVRVAAVNDAGEITKLEILETGFGWDPSLLKEPRQIDHRGTFIEYSVGQYYTDIGRYINDLHRLNSYSFIVGNRIYQSFSYIIQSNYASKFWYHDVKKYLHPAGFYFVGMMAFYTNLLEGDGVLDLGVEFESSAIEIEGGA